MTRSHRLSYAAELAKLATDTLRRQLTDDRTNDGVAKAVMLATQLEQQCLVLIARATERERHW